jgi:hypothetical protein
VSAPTLPGTVLTTPPPPQARETDGTADTSAAESSTNLARKPILILDKQS